MGHQVHEHLEVGDLLETRVLGRRAARWQKGVGIRRFGQDFG
jgi:hypothetical protein